MNSVSSLLCIVALFIVSTGFAEPGTNSDFAETSYPITDFYFGLPVFQSSDNAIIRDLDLATSLGWMFVLDDRIDLGPSLFFSSYKNGGWHSQIGARANFRYNLNDSFNLNLSPGLIFSDSPFPDGFAGYTAELSLGWKRWAGLSIRLDSVDTFQSDHDQILHIGLQFGSYAGMGLSALGAISGGIAYWADQMD